MLFEQDRERISVNEVICDRAGPLHRPYSCHSDGMWARDRVYHKRDSELKEGDAATATMDKLRGEYCDKVSSSVKITAINMASEDEAVPSEPIYAVTKLDETKTDYEEPRDSESDRNRLSHYLGEKIMMEYRAEHGQSETVMW